MIDIQFEQSPWEAYLNSCKNGASISAWNLISMLEDEDGAGDVSLVLRAKDADSDSANLLDMVAVVPDSADGWLLDKLKMNGLRVVEYESGNEAARQAALEDAREMAEKRLDEPKRGAKLSADRGEALRRKEEKHITEKRTGLWINRFYIPVWMTTCPC